MRVRYSFRVLNFVLPAGGQSRAEVARTTSDVEQSYCKISWLLALYDKYLKIIQLWISCAGIAQSV